MLCHARVHAETVSQHFHELLRISTRQIFIFLSCSTLNIDISTNSGIPILTVLVCSHLLQIGGYHHSHHQMRGRTRTISQCHHSQRALREANNLPTATVCKAAIHTMLLGIMLVMFLVFIFRIRQDPKFLALIFSKCQASTSLFLAANAEKAA